MKHKVRAAAGGLIRKLGRTFGIGVITIIPFALTILILWWAFNSIDDILQPAIGAIWGDEVPGMGFVISILVILLTGFIASNVIGRKFIRYIEAAIPFMPVIRWIYSGIKQIVQSFTIPQNGLQMKPVLIEFPRKGMKVIGFITNELTSDAGNKTYSIFIPTSPNPTSGYLQIVNESELTPLNISIDDALKMIVSAGRVVPGDLAKELAGE